MDDSGNLIEGVASLAPNRVAQRNPPGDRLCVASSFDSSENLASETIKQAAEFDSLPVGVLRCSVACEVHLALSEAF